MSNLQLTITNSPFRTSEAVEQTEPKINGRTIEQDNINPAKRVKLEADDAWEYALDNPIGASKSCDKEVLIYIAGLQITARSPEAKGRLIVEFPGHVLTQLFTYLDVPTIGSLLSLCQFGNTCIRNIFFMQANLVSSYLYHKPFTAVGKLSQSATLKLLDASLESLNQYTYLATTEAVLDPIYTGLQGTDKALTMEQIRESFDEAYFNGDEKVFLQHVMSFNHPIYQKTETNIVKRFSDYHNYLLDLPNNTDEDNTESQRQYQDNNQVYTSDRFFFPLRLIQNPQEIECLHFCDMGLVTLPPQIGDCINLQELFVEQVNCLPTEIGQLTSLRSLTFQYHNLRALPDSIVNLTKLTYLQFEADELQDLHITFESLTPAQKEWIWTLKENGCTIELMDVPPRD